jgi:hypothetical protein
MKQRVKSVLFILASCAIGALITVLASEIIFDK